MKLHKRVPQKYWEHLIDEAMRYYRGCVTIQGRHRWLKKADGYALKLKRLQELRDL